MARYVLFTIKSDEASLNAMMSDERAAINIINTLDTSINSRKLSAFPSKRPGNTLGNPLPLTLGTTEIGSVLGYYYDSDVVGVATLPAQIPANSYAFTISTDNFVFLYPFEELSGKCLKEWMEWFDEDPSNSHVRMFHFAPVFKNGSEAPVDLCILKRTPLRPEDAHLIIDVGGPFSMPSGYDGPRMA